MNFGYLTTFQSMDKGLIENVGPSGFSFSIFNISSNFVSYSSGFLYHTIFIITSFILLFLSIFFGYSFGFSLFINFQFSLLIFAILLVSLLKPTIKI